MTKHEWSTLARAHSLSTGDNSLVLIMRPNPKPVHRIALDIRERPVARVADPNRPDFPDFLEMQ